MRVGAPVVGAGLRGAGQPPQDKQRRKHCDQQGAGHDDADEAGERAVARQVEPAEHRRERPDADHDDQRVQNVKPGPPGVVHAPPGGGETGQDRGQGKQRGDRPVGLCRDGAGPGFDRSRTEELAIEDPGDRAAQHDEEHKIPVFRPRGAAREGHVLAEAGAYGVGEGHRISHAPALTGRDGGIAAGDAAIGITQVASRAAPASWAKARGASTAHMGNHGSGMRVANP